MNKWCLITGCNSLLGIAMAKEALGLGYDILACYNRKKERLLELQQNCQRRIKIIQATFTENGISDLQKNLESFEEPISALVNNAGSFAGEISLGNFKPEVIMKCYAINAMAPLLLSGYIFESMKKKGGGKIINISSVTAKYGGSEKNIHYGMSKAALDATTVFFARIGAPYNVLVNSIRPGLIDTEFHENNTPERDLSSRIKLNPLKRMAKVEEISGFAGYLLSEKGNYITGQILTVAGGD